MRRLGIGNLLINTMTLLWQLTKRTSKLTEPLHIKSTVWKLSLFFFQDAIGASPMEAKTNQQTVGMGLSSDKFEQDSRSFSFNSDSVRHRRHLSRTRYSSV